MTHSFVLTPYFLDQPITEAEHLAQPEWRVNAPELAGTTQLQRLAEVHRHLRNIVCKDARAYRVPVCFGGDCVQSIAVLAGLQRAGLDPVVVWLDAHGDFNTPETSPSGFLGGMPLAMLVGRGDETLTEAAGMSLVEERDVILAGARDLDPKEREALEGSQVCRLQDLGGIVAKLPGSRPVYVHLDCDVIDPTDAPAVLYPVSGGPRLTDVQHALSALRGTGRVAGVSVAMWQVAKDADRSTERACLSAVESLCS